MNPSNADIAKLIRVLTEAGWIARCDMSSQQIVFTPMGLERMEKLAALLPSLLKIIRGGHAAKEMARLERELPDLITTVRRLNLPASFFPLLAGFVTSWKSDCKR